MAHYIAEQIQQVETAHGEDRDTRLSECCDAILKIWSHRSQFSRRRPLQSFEAVFRVLEGLDPKNSRLRYVDNVLESSTVESGETQQWLSKATEVDSAARAVVRFCIRKAAETALDIESEWVRLARGISSGADADLRVIADLLEVLGAQEVELRARRETEDLIRRLRQLRSSSQAYIVELRDENS